MTDKELLKKIKELEKKVADLESRPVYVPYPYPNYPYIPSIPSWQQPNIVYCTQTGTTS